MPQKTSFGAIGPSGAPAGGALMNESSPLGGSVDPTGGKSVAKGHSFAYRPEWEIFIKSMVIPVSPNLAAAGVLEQANRYAESTGGDLWRVSNALVGQASLTRQEDGEATFAFELNNTGYVFSDSFEEMDMVKCFLKGVVGEWTEAFTGFIQDITDNDPDLQGGTLSFQCYDVGKRMRIYTISPGDTALLRKMSAFERMEDYLKWYAKKAGWRLDQEVEVEPMESAESFVGRFNDNLTPSEVEGSTDYASNAAKKVAEWLDDPSALVDAFNTARANTGGWEKGNQDFSGDEKFWPVFQAYWATRETARGHDPQWIADHMPQTAADALGNDWGKDIEYHDPLPEHWGHESVWHNLFKNVGGWTALPGNAAPMELSDQMRTAQQLNNEIFQGLSGSLNSSEATALAEWIDSNIIGKVPGLEKATKITDAMEASAETSFFRDDFVYPIRKVVESSGKGAGDLKNDAQHFTSLDDMTMDFEGKTVVFYPTKNVTEEMTSDDAEFLDNRIKDAMSWGVSYVQAMKMALGPDTVDYAIATAVPKSDAEPTTQPTDEEIKAKKSADYMDYLETHPDISDPAKEWLKKKAGTSLIATARQAWQDPNKAIEEGWRAVACCSGKIVAKGILRDYKGIGLRVVLEADKKEDSASTGENAEKARASQFWVDNKGDEDVSWEYADDEQKTKKSISREEFIKRSVKNWQMEDGRDTQDGQLPADAEDNSTTDGSSAPSGRETNQNENAAGGKKAYPTSYFFYDHLDDGNPPVVKVGDRVKPGQLIGYLGHTGCEDLTVRLSFSWSPYGITGKFSDPGPLLQMTQTSGGAGQDELNYNDMEYSPYMFADEWVSRQEAKKFSESLNLPFYDEEKIIDRFSDVAQKGNYHWWVDGKGKLIVRHPRYFNAPKKYVPRALTINGTLTKSDQNMATHVYVLGDVDWDWQVSNTVFTPDVMEVGKCTVEDNNATVFAWNRGYSPRQICNKFGVRKFVESDQYLHNRQQCTRYAMYKFAEQNRMRYTGSFTTVLDPTHEIMDQVFFETKNMMFTLLGITHTFGPDAQSTTALTCVAGVKPEEFGMLRNWLASILSIKVGTAQSELDRVAKEHDKNLAAYAPEINLDPNLQFLKQLD